MTRKKIVTAFLFFLLIPHSVPAASKPYRIGIVLPGDQWASSVEGFKEGMKRLDDIEEKGSLLLEMPKGTRKRWQRIWLESEVGKRATFYFTMPA